MISIIIPVYNEEENVKELHREILEVCQKLNQEFEIIFVDDGSQDSSWTIIENLKKQNPIIKAVKLRKNFGKSAALAVGFQRAKGDTIITMDADLQDDPREIPQMLDKLAQGNDVVSGWRIKRQDTFFRVVASKIYNRVTTLIMDIKLHDFNCGFKAYRSSVIKNIPLYGELHRYLPVLAQMMGFKISEIKVQNRHRKYGKSKFGIERYLRAFFDLLTVLFLSKYSKKPMHIFGGIGLLLIFLGVISNFYLLILQLSGEGIGNRPLLLIGVFAIIVGIQFLSLGLLAELINHKLHKDTENQSHIENEIR